MAKITGWGLANTSLGSRPKVLQEQDLPVVTTETCQRRMGFVSFFGKNYSLPVTESMFCMGSLTGGTGGCGHDSGEHTEGESKTDLRHSFLWLE